MKSIICTHRWQDLVHVKAHHLSDTSPNSSSSSPSSNPKRIPHTNVLKLRFQLNAPERVKQYRFDSRPILDEFLAEAMRNNALERVVERKMLLGTTVKYVPIGKVAAHETQNGPIQAENNNQISTTNGNGSTNGTLKKRSKNKKS